MGIFEYDAADVLEAVKQWIPGPVFTESRCRDSLFNFLTDSLSRHDLTKEALVAHGGRADILVRTKGFGGTPGATVAIEVKYDLVSTNEYKRLVGQVAEYIRDKHELIVVLCGRTRPEFFRGVAAHMGTLASSGRLAFKGYVVEKATGTRTGKGHFLPGNAKAAIPARTRCRA